MEYKFSFEVIWHYIGVLFGGLTITLQITGISMFLGLILGIFLAIFRLSPNFFINKTAALYIEFFRCTPVLVQLVWVFYCLPIILGVMINSYFSSIITLSLYISACYAEVIRSGIQAIEQEQISSAIALGLSPVQRMRYVILPQAFRIIIPTLLTYSVSLFKESSLVSTVGMSDLMYVGKLVSIRSYRPIEILTTVAIIYFLVAFPVTILARKLEIALAQRLDR